MINDFRFLHYPEHIYIDDSGVACLCNSCHKRVLYKEEAIHMIEHYGELLTGLKKFVKKLDKYGVDNNKIGEFNDMYQKEYDEECKKNRIPIKKTNDHLYLFQNSETKHFKIGRSKNVKSRLNSLNLASPHRIDLIFEIKEKGPLEKRVHGLFSKLRTNSEWFEGEDCIFKFFEEMKNEETNICQ